MLSLQLHQLGTYYFDKNPRGDVIAILDNSGNTVVKYTYDAYGNCNCTYSYNTDLANSNPIRYRSYYYDEDTGLYYLNARYYNPEWRRFISPDDTAYLDTESVNGLNLYAYCGNDPVNYVDPSGHSSTALILLGAFALGAIIGGGVSVATQYVENDFNFNEVNPWLVLSDTIFGGVSGLLAASGIGTIGSAFLGATLSAVQLATTSAITGEEITAIDLMVTVSLGFVGGLIPKTGINAKQVSGKYKFFSYHINNAISIRRHNMYLNKFRGLTGELIFCGINYASSTIISDVMSDHISNNMESFLYGF